MLKPRRLSRGTTDLSLLSVLCTAALLLLVQTDALATGACCLVCEPENCVIVEDEEECLGLGGFFMDGSTCEDCPMPSIVPSPEKCTVTPADALVGFFVCPSLPVPAEASMITVTVINSCDQVVQNATVVVALAAANPVCPGGVLSGITNREGQVVLTLSASGCSDGVPLSGIIKANGLTIRAYENVKSPDSDTDGSVGLGDLVEFSSEFLGNTPTTCHDYDNDGETGLSDLVLMGPPFSARNHCP